MIQNLSIIQETEQDLHIAKHIAPESLPAMIQPIMSLAQSDAERDILLLSLLTAAGSCMPKLFFRYGLTGKRYYANLQTFIVGSAACGKGIANLALELVRPIHEATPLLIPGDATYPAFYQQLAKQHGRGYIHESEGSVITDVWRSSTVSYNTALRKAAEHETISRSRCREASVIPCPQLSMLLTGTFGQYHALVPSVENGYFSRLLTLIVDEHQAFSSRYVQPAEKSDGIIGTCAQQLYRLYESLYGAKPREFSLTDDQRTRLGQHLETAYPTLIRLLGEDFHSVILRMAVHIERIAMILTALRMPSTMNGRLECSDEDYRTAELIGNKLILHMAQAFQLIRGSEKPTIPSVKPLDQKQILLSLLPEEFESKRLVAEAQMQGIPQSTIMRWCSQWIETGLVCRLSYGHYKKMA